MSEPTPIHVSYPSMVSYVDRRLDSLRRTVRESSAQTAAMIADSQSSVDRHMAALHERLNDHDTWHRDQLTGQLSAGASLRASWAANGIAFLSLIVAVVAIAAAMLAH